ncbi:MAG TPA: MFS transporter [Acidimicrobiia bacterium]|nr:MFS transporter [Acidimicrobiia bacterium]
MTTLATGFTDTFRSLAVRNFRLFFIGQFISQTGTWMTMVAQTLLVLELTRSGIVLGLLAACQFGPVLLLGAFAGTIADRYDKRRVLFFTQAGAMLQSLILGTVVLTGNASVGVILPLAALQGVLTAFDNPSRRAFVVEMVPPSHVSNAVSLNSTLMTGSRVFGPALAGFLVLTVGYAWCFYLDGLSYIAVLASLAAMRTAELFPATPHPRGRGQTREGLRYVRSHRDLFVPLAMMAIIGTIAFNFSVTAPLLVTGPLEAGEQAYTWLFSTMSVAAVVGALATARRETVPKSHLVGSAALFGLGMVILAASPTMAVAYLGAVVVGLGSIGFMTSSTALVQLLAAPAYRGRVLALQAMVFLGSTPIGGPLVGWVADQFGARAAILLGAAACFGAATWAHLTWRRPAPTPVLPQVSPAEVPGFPGGAS